MVDGATVVEVAGLFCCDGLFELVLKATEVVVDAAAAVVAWAPSSVVEVDAQTARPADAALARSD